MLKYFIIIFVSLNAVGSSEATEIKLPLSLNCRWNSQVDLLYTRLERISQLSQLPEKLNPLEVWGKSESGEGPRADEVAYGWIGDYYNATVSQAEYNYNLWTCDTEDRSYSFQSHDLILPGNSPLKTKQVQGKLIISVRDDEKRYDLNCTAQY